MIVSARNSMAMGICLAASLAWTGCDPSRLEPLGPLRPDTSLSVPVVDYSYLAIVLMEAVTEDGLLIPTLLSGDANALERQLASLAVNGPTVTPARFPSDEHKLAYWYNARASWTMKLALTARFESRQWLRRHVRRKLLLDGRLMTLRDIDRQIDRVGGWQAVVAAPGVTLRRAPLPQVPFEASDVREMIDRRFQEVLHDPQRVAMDYENRRVYYPPVIWYYRETLLAEHHRMYGTTGANLTTALLKYARDPAHYRLQTAVGFEPARARGFGSLALFRGLW
jgi:hypothetical protein